MSVIAGRNALVTGASYGIGPTIARMLAVRGARVALVARSAEPLERLAREIQGSGGRALAIPADLRDVSSRDEVVRRAESELGPIDILINNAGVHHVGRLHVRSAEQIDAVMETNLLAAIALTRSVLPGMLERRVGHVIQVASLAGKVGLPYASVYAAAKHGVVGFTHALQAELKGTGVRASVVCPGFISEDGMWARLGRRVHPAFGLSHPERVARAVLTAISRNRVEILVNPLPVRPVIALWALWPGLATGVFGLLGVESSLRGVALQVEAEDDATRP